MSRLPASELRVMLAPDGFQAQRVWWRWRGVPRRERADQVCESSTSLAAALSALEALLREQGSTSRLHVTLSNRLVRYALVPWQPGLAGAAAQAWQRDCFVQVYGDSALAWHIAVTPPSRRAPGVGSAVDAKVVSELQALCQRTGARMMSLQPQLAVVVNRWRHALRGDCFWLALAEPGHLCVALAQQRAWRVVRSTRTGGAPLAALDALLSRETLLADTDATPDRVYLWAPQLGRAGVEHVGALPATWLEAEESLATGEAAL